VRHLAFLATRVRGPARVIPVACFWLVDADGQRGLRCVRSHRLPIKPVHPLHYAMISDKHNFVFKTTRYDTKLALIYMSLTHVK
jgi:hypothetical protein